MLLSENPDNYDYLAHHGIKGQKWGIRRYQKLDGTLTKLGRKRLGIGESRKQQRQEAKAKKKQAEEQKKIADAKEKLRKETIRDPRKLYKYKDVFTRDEIAKIMEDIDFDRKVKSIHDKDVAALSSRMKQFADLTQNVSNIFKNTTSIYNSTADVYNMFADTKKIKHPDVKVKKLVKIGTNNDALVEKAIKEYMEKKPD